MTSPWIAALFALFLWWVSTGAILMAVRFAEARGPTAGRWLTWGALPILALGLWGVWVSAQGTSVQAAYGGFLSALAIWGWVELAFLTGTITGPNRYDCPPGLPGWERFIRAWGTIAYHEALLTGGLIAFWLLGHGAASTVGLWTFTVLYFARISAKLNLFFGVPYINTEFLPGALAHLASHFRTARLNWIFPLSVTTLSFASACWLERLITAPSPASAVGYSLLAAITALALLEHWLMVLPLPDAKLWRWMLPAPKPKTEGTHGL